MAEPNGAVGSLVRGLSAGWSRHLPRLTKQQRLTVGLVLSISDPVANCHICGDLNAPMVSRNLSFLGGEATVRGIDDRDTVVVTL